MQLCNGGEIPCGRRPAACIPPVGAFQRAKTPQIGAKIASEDAARSAGGGTLLTPFCVRPAVWYARALNLAARRQCVLCSQTRVCHNTCTTHPVVIVVHV